MFERTISTATKNSLELINQCDFIDGWYLAGGTAAALQLGHRTSLDLDFFTPQEVNEQQIIESLTRVGNFSLEQKAWQTVHGMLNNTKVSFIHYPYELLFPTVLFLNVPLADIRDIACMKLDAIASRGSKKDFIDMYYILKQYSLKEILAFFETKYADIDYNILHIVKSLTYFDDAQEDPMPHMFEEIDWEKIQQWLIAETKKV